MNTWICIFLGLSCLLSAQTIEEKKESFKKTSGEIDRAMMRELQEVNHLLEIKRSELKQLLKKAYQAYQEKSPSFDPLLTQIKLLREEITEIQNMWRDEAHSFFQKDIYALWHQSETNLENLVLYYGSSQAIYFIPPEIGTIQLSLHSNLPIPQESWEECLELILARYGIGVRNLNAYIKELYFMRNDHSGALAIVDSVEKLGGFPLQAHLCFILSPQNIDPKGDMKFLKKFSNPSTITLDCIGGENFYFWDTCSDWRVDPGLPVCKICWNHTRFSNGHSIQTIGCRDADSSADRLF